jgi:hypothetical protein
LEIFLERMKMPHINFVHEELLLLRWVVFDAKDKLTPDHRKELLWKLDKMLEGDGEKLVVVSCMERGGH